MIHVKEKKNALMSLIDDMTAAAVDRSSQGHIQFLELRNELMAKIDDFYREDEHRNEVVKLVMKELNELALS
jgi:hypothetical protein